MKINPISTNAFIKKSSPKTKMQPKNTAYSNVFIKNTNLTPLSFTSLYSKDKYAQVKKELTQYIHSCSNISESGIQEIISKYIEEIPVKDLSEIDYSSTNANQSTAGYFKNPAYLTIDSATSNLALEEVEKTLYLKMDDTKNGKIAKSIFLARLMHEITHIIQESRSNKNAKINIHNAALSSMTEMEAIDTIQAETQAFSSIEYSLLSVLAKSAPNMRNVPTPVENASRGALNAYIKRATGLYAENLVQECVSQITRKVLEEFPNADKKYIYQYISLCAYNEKEAYQNELNILKDEFNIKGPTTHDFRIEMYDLLGEHAKMLASRL